MAAFFPCPSCSIAFFFLCLFTWGPSEVLAVVVFAVATEVVFRAPPAAAVVVQRQRLPPLPRRRASRVMISFCAFVARAPLAFFFLLLFLPSFLSVAWMVCCFV